MSGKRRQRGTGTVARHGTRWRFRAVDGQGGRYVSPAEYATEADARRGLAAFAARVARGDLVITKGITLRSYYETHWLPFVEAKRRPGTAAAYRSRWAQIGRAPFADKPLVGITRKEIRLWADRLTVQRPDSVLAALKAIFQRAVSHDELLTINPARDIRVEMQRRDSDELRPTPEEARALLTCEAIPREDRLIIAFALGTGLRPGEWRALELADVHLDAEVPYVLVQFGGSDRAPTKTGKKRRVPLLGSTPEVLRSWLECLPTYAKANPSGLVFPTATGAQREPSWPFGRRGKERIPLWPEWLAAAGITRRLVPHSLRHGCATDLLVGGLEAWQVQTLLGHGRLTTTLRYLHAGEKDLFHSLRDKDQLRTKVSETPVKQGENELAEQAGFEPAPLPQNPGFLPVKAENGFFGPYLGLISRLSDLASRAARGAWPSDRELIDLLRDLDDAHADADPLRRAISRGLGGHPRAALADLVRLLLPDESARPAKRGAR